MAVLKKALENKDQEQHGYMGIDEDKNQSSNRVSREQTLLDLAFGVPSFELNLLVAINDSSIN